MKLNNHILYLLIMLITLSACKNNSNIETINHEYMQFNTKIDTKVNHNVFATTDEIGLYIVERISQGLPDNNLEDLSLAIEKNLKCTTDGSGHLVTPHPIDYPAKNIDAHAYYPYSSDPVNQSDTKNRAFSVKANQSAKDDYFQSDFKKATVKNWVKPDPKKTESIPLTFNHQLSKITITLKSTTKNIDELLNLIQTIKFENVALNGTFDMMTNKVTGDFSNAESNTIIPFGQLVKQDNVLKGIEVILIPCEANQAPKLVIETNDNKYTANFTDKLEQGKEYIYIVNVTDGELMSYTVELAPWNSSSSSVILQVANN